MQAQRDDLQVITDDHGRPWPERRKVHHGTPQAMRPLVWAEDFLHYAVAAVLIAAAFVVLGRAIYTAVVNDGSLSRSIPALVDSVLFVIIVLEIFTTVLSHFRDGGLQLQPFIVIGIISSVRHLLVVGARSSLGEDIKDFERTMVELAVNVGIAVALVVALVLLRRAHHPEE
jgi:uncharacterized membrane protein (DUF373 family)